MKRLAHALLWILYGALAVVLLLWAMSYFPIPVDVFQIVRAIVCVIAAVVVIGAIATNRNPLKWE